MEGDVLLGESGVQVRRYLDRGVAQLVDSLALNQRVVHLSPCHDHENGDVTGSTGF